MSLIYIWQNRERPQILSKRWFKVWAKRVLNFSGLLSVTTRTLRYRLKGMQIGRLATFGELDLNGPASRLSVGERSFISTGVHLALHDKITIGNRVVINSNVQLLTGSHDVNDSSWRRKDGPIIINDYAWIAQNAIILPGVTIGRGAVVGAGAVVSRDIPANGIVVGNPAKLIDKIRNDKLDYSPVDLIACYEAWLGNKLMPIDLNN